MWIKLIQACTMTSKSIKDISMIPSFLIGKWCDRFVFWFIQKTIYTVEDTFHFLLSQLTLKILSQYIEDYYTLISFAYWGLNISHGI